MAEGVVRAGEKIDGSFDDGLRRGDEGVERVSDCTQVEDGEDAEEFGEERSLYIQGLAESAAASD